MIELTTNRENLDGEPLVIIYDPLRNYIFLEIELEEPILTTLANDSSLPLVHKDSKAYVPVQFFRRAAQNCGDDPDMADIIKKNMETLDYLEKLVTETMQSDRGKAALEEYASICAESPPILTYSQSMN